MVPRAVDAVISDEMTSLNQLRPLAPIVLSWLKENLLLAHDDEERKRKMGLILGTRRFVHNLPHFGLWEDFIDDSKIKALYLGQEMQKYYEDNDLRTVLGGAGRCPRSIWKMPCWPRWSPRNRPVRR